MNLGRSATRHVTCIACGDHVPRTDAREYDKYGDRWDRHDKDFEYLCKPCDDERCHQSRAELESLLVEVNAGELPDEEFLSWYLAVAEERYGPVHERT